MGKSKFAMMKKSLKKYSLKKTKRKEDENGKECIPNSRSTYLISNEKDYQLYKVQFHIERHQNILSVLKPWITY